MYIYHVLFPVVVTRPYYTFHSSFSYLYYLILSCYMFSSCTFHILLSCTIHILHIHLYVLILSYTLCFRILSVLFLCWLKANTFISFSCTILCTFYILYSCTIFLYLYSCTGICCHIFPFHLILSYTILSYDIHILCFSYTVLFICFSCTILFIYCHLVLYFLFL